MLENYKLCQFSIVLNLKAPYFSPEILGKFLYYVDEIFQKKLEQN